MAGKYDKILGVYRDKDAGTPGGATTNIQYNTSGAFDGNANFTYDAANNLVLIGTTPTSTQRNGLFIYDGGLGIKGRIDEGTTDIRFTMGLGPSGDSARCLFGSTVTNWEIDNLNGVFRWFVPGRVEMYMYPFAGGNQVDFVSNKNFINVGGMQFTGGLTQSGVNANTFTGATTFSNNVTISAANLITDTTTGMKIGTATTQKIGFYNSTPIVQPGATTDLGTVLSNLGLRATGTAYPLTTSGALTFSGTIAVTGNAVTYDNLIWNNNAITASANAATVPVTFRISTVTNNSAAGLTITITTTGAVNKQFLVVDVLDFSAAAQTITWVNTENSTVSVPTTSNGSTTLPLSVGFKYNSATSKWRCVASA